MHVRYVLWVVLGLGAAGASLFGGFVWAFRRKYAPVQDRIRRFNRDVTNRLQLRVAGQPGAYASIVHHVGRSSGRPYRTPAVAVPVDGGFVFALPYGPGVDWVRNLVAAGTGSVEHEGRTVAVRRPELVGREEADRHFPAVERRMHRRYGVRDFLRLEAVDHAGSSTAESIAGREVAR